jgi:hypothetical protein
VDCGALPVAGGPETGVLPGLSGRMWGNWALCRRGIYFLASISPRNQRSRSAVRTAFPWPGTRDWAVSSDERKLLFAQVDRAGSNIYIADNFTE